MRIAFDVMGTIEGHKQHQVLELFRHLQEMGHEMTVWSSDWGMAVRARDKHGLKATTCEKFSKYDAKILEKPLFDLAIDDDHSSKEYLATERVVMVQDLRGDMKELAEKLTLKRIST